MANVPDDWGCYYETCGYCGRRYHASEGGCSCTDFLADCHCGENSWEICRHGVRCSECGSEPGETYTECHCCGATMPSDVVIVEMESARWTIEPEAMVWCPECYEREDR